MKFGSSFNSVYCFVEQKIQGQRVSSAIDASFVVLRSAGRACCWFAHSFFFWQKHTCWKFFL